MFVDSALVVRAALASTFAAFGLLCLFVLYRRLVIHADEVKSSTSWFLVLCTAWAVLRAIFFAFFSEDGGPMVALLWWMPLSVLVLAYSLIALWLWNTARCVGTYQEDPTAYLVTGVGNVLQTVINTAWIFMAPFGEAAQPRLLFSAGCLMILSVALVSGGRKVMRLFDTGMVSQVFISSRGIKLLAFAMPAVFMTRAIYDLAAFVYPSVFRLAATDSVNVVLLIVWEVAPAACIVHWALAPHVADRRRRSFSASTALLHPERLRVNHGGSTDGESGYDTVNGNSSAAVGYTVNWGDDERWREDYGGQSSGFFSGSESATGGGPVIAHPPHNNHRHIYNPQSHGNAIGAMRRNSSVAGSPYMASSVGTLPPLSSLTSANNIPPPTSLTTPTPSSLSQHHQYHQPSGLIHGHNGQSPHVVAPPAFQSYHQMTQQQPPSSPLASSRSAMLRPPPIISSESTLRNSHIHEQSKREQEALAAASVTPQAHSHMP